jgi:dTDP-glucose 4,6-dehydratase
MNAKDQGPQTQPRTAGILADQHSAGATNPLAADLDHILAHTRDLFEPLRGGRIFITGGTGFFGAWILESFLRMNDALNLNAAAVVLTRNPGSFAAASPHLANHPAISLLAGDVKSFDFPTGEFRAVIHAATESGTQLNRDAPLAMVDTIVAGTRRVLDFARRAGARDLLFTSSGAVYGAQPPEITHVAEDYSGGPNPLDIAAAYGESKRIAEYLCAAYAAGAGADTLSIASADASPSIVVGGGSTYDAASRAGDQLIAGNAAGAVAQPSPGHVGANVNPTTILRPKIARCFAFVGPGLPIDAHFAIGNFVRDAISGRPIVIKGDGTPMRSYLYAADLAIWLWTILFRGEPARAYNVGSDAAISIADLATLVADTIAGMGLPRSPVTVLGKPNPNARRAQYVPSISRARTELKLEPWTPLAKSIEKTAIWHMDRNASMKR